MLSHKFCLFNFILSFSILFIGCVAQQIDEENIIQCPSETSELISKDTGREEGVTITFHNNFFDDVILYWVSFSGEDKMSNIIGFGDLYFENSYAGHVYRVRTFERVLLMEYIIDTEESNIHVNITACQGTKESPLWEKGRDHEFTDLIVPNPSVCQPKNDSSKWTCIRKVSEEEQRSRIKDDYGFHAIEARGYRSRYQVRDDTYINHISRIPSFSEVGYLIVDQTDKMKKCLTPWIKEKLQYATQHEPVGGDYTNMHIVPLSKLNLDQYQHIRVCIVSEMKQLSQWWIKRKLKHTATFGMRIYHRDSMLINHVDRADTHIISAVVQVVQETDPNSGWPLELENENGLHEVYLQPGKMVFYEGARLFHGRPMRFKGEKFGNIFTHFAPVDWFGPDSNVPAWAIKNIEARQNYNIKKQDINNNKIHIDL